MVLAWSDELDWQGKGRPSSFAVEIMSDTRARELSSLHLQLRQDKDGGAGRKRVWRKLVVVELGKNKKFLFAGLLFGKILLDSACRDFKQLRTV